MGLYEVHCNDTIGLVRVLIALGGRARAGRTSGAGRAQGARLSGGVLAGARDAVVLAQSTHVLPLEFNRRYPVLVRGKGVWVEDASGKRYLDAMSGGSMAATLGHGRKDIVAAARTVERA